MSADAPLRNTDVRRAALIAAVGAALIAASPFTAGMPQARTVGLSVVPNVAWCGFYLAFWRQTRIRSAAITALVLAIPARVLFLVAYVTSTLTTNGLGWTIVAAECFSTVGWALLLVTLAANLRKPPLENTAAVLAIVVLAASADDVLVATARLMSATGTAGVFWRANPLGTFWRAVGDPAAQLFSIVTQVNFLRTLAKSAEPRASWAHLGGAS